MIAEMADKLNGLDDLSIEQLTILKTVISELIEHKTKRENRKTLKQNQYSVDGMVNTII
jgi:hypothetical protein